MGGASTAGFVRAVVVRLNTSREDGIIRVLPRGDMFVTPCKSDSLLGAWRYCFERRYFFGLGLPYVEGSSPSARVGPTSSRRNSAASGGPWQAALGPSGLVGGGSQVWSLCNPSGFVPSCEVPSTERSRLSLAVVRHGQAGLIDSVQNGPRHLRAPQLRLGQTFDQLAVKLFAI